ncbi:sodium-dependent transporter [Brachybacterium sp. JB7]|uniref:sodium-dependent transporter n=1 Tax=Brachybacterium TaxID=43668 RepID=UPI000DF26A52|nr:MULTISPECIES: sodium-dependent transporter [Brachybacterium]RCS60292.1 sodium-dependent transporter [Brachybacterium sp. JB7]RCS66821.1 sodium-dependent transporter [Brachybacterium alimentarium]RCS77764.1 sodium-dependent transporter [Brachybacterium alimentarium]RCS87763.1 sodium-dependent transporter [Brachybacterium alimentarium]RCS88010.1 sodium-dependent transporter [Brachybacterium alimentarium]
MSAPSPSPAAKATSADRGAFSGRTAFIFAAIGSAVGLGNIWRFPAVAYENGGGAFILPYLVALLTAGIPLLFLDYAIGHRWRGSAPTAWRRFKRWTEFIGWWQVLIALIIALYYALILAWATNYTIFSLDQRWGDDPAGFFGEYTQALGGAEATISFDIVPAVLVSMIIVWLAVIIVMALGVQKGIAASSVVFIPLLVLMFVILVARALFLPGAIDGLEALFKPNWGALLDPSVWIAAYGQIFFSLSVAFGIMLTYSSYLKKKTDLTGSGLVVGFANSSFEILAGIGVFSALGFMAQAQGVAIDEVVTDGVGLAFIAFPAIISQAPTGAGTLIGVLFFGSLVLAGFTSLISIVEVVIAAIQDKFGFARIAATLWVCVPLAVVSTALFSTTMGLPLLDVLDKWANEYGIVAAALVSTIVVTYVVRGLPTLRDHLNHQGTFGIGTWWLVCVGVIAPLVLGASLVLSTRDLLMDPNTYEGYPGWFVFVFGWLMAIGLVVIAIGLSLIPWPAGSNLHKDDSDGDPIAPEAVAGRGLVTTPEAATPHELRSAPR